ncbi:MAG: TonB-dependent receptor-like protein [Sphingobium sp.]|nr:TonB-dependent receptor-like protein [Sphingobium sp.]
MSPTETRERPGLIDIGGLFMPMARNWVASSLLAIAIVHTLPIVDAREDSGASALYNLPAQPLASTLLAIGQLSGQQIVFPGDAMTGLKAPRIEGRLDVETALARALAGTGFRVEIAGDAIYIRLPSRGAIGERDERSDSAIIVTGSHIRGAASASPVYRYDTATARDQGVTDMRGLAAAIPQNFTGGQNPGIGYGAEGAGSTNIDSSTALNLRGLGPGSTLTLLNGHRMAYNLSNQSVDFSSIPFAAVDRVEIMPDGASALYGSDAIGGVANVILKNDFRGFSANAVIGAATDGGYVTQSYNLVGGTAWQSGSLMLTGNYDRSTDIVAGDRSFTAGANPYLTLYPPLRSHAVVGSAHQDIGPNLTLAIDALYSARKASRDTPYTDVGPVELDGFVSTSASRNFSIAPSVRLRLSGWTFDLIGTYGTSHLTSGDQSYPGPYREVKLGNETISAEFSAEGTLLALPAGDLGLAFGGGFRTDEFVYHLPSNPLRARQDNYFGYAEVSIPLTSPTQAIPAFYRTSLSAAIRYEDYPGMGRLATPKVGFIWSPTADLDVKLGWGRSFKAPTLYQRFNPTIAYLFPGDLYGSREAPEGQTIISVQGGKNDLRPEKADSFTAGLVVHPRAVPELDLAISLFKVTYRNRVVAPIPSTSKALIDPVYADFVTFMPSAADIASTIAMSPMGLSNQTGTSDPFDPASVFAIVDSRTQNVARDKIKGVDVSLAYQVKTHGTGTFNFHANATYLRSSRVLIDGLPEIVLAGKVFSPPHLKLRGGVGWALDGVMVNGVANYIGGVTDNRRLATTKIRGLTSIDLSAKVRAGSVDNGVDVQLSVLNIFNAKPAIIRGSSLEAPFDTTNYPSIGRYVSLSFTKGF